MLPESGEGWSQCSCSEKDGSSLVPRAQNSTRLRCTLTPCSGGAACKKPWGSRVAPCQRRGTEVQSWAEDLMGGPEPWFSVLHARRPSFPESLHLLGQGAKAMASLAGC